VNPGFWLEDLQYAKTRKRWFVLSLIMTLAVIGLLVVLAETLPVLSPFVYTLF
jgi:hypothetical protein